MEQRPGWLNMQCAQIAAGLAVSIENKDLHEAQEGYARSVLSYYNSSLHLIPDILPGIGFLDDYLMLVSAMWICETGVEELDYGSLMRLPYRIGKLLEAPPQPSLADLALDAAKEKKEQLAKEKEAGAEQTPTPDSSEISPEEIAAEKAKLKRDKLDDIRSKRRKRQSPFSDRGGEEEN
jgi:hypothetical protein